MKEVDIMHSPVESHSDSHSTEEELAVRTVIIQGYWLVLVVNLSLLAGATIAPVFEWNLTYLAISLAAALQIFISTFRRARILITPVTLYAAIWLVIVPLTSLDAPLMPAMSLQQIRLCLIGGSVYATGGLVVGLVNRSGTLTGHTPRNAILQTSRRLMQIAHVLLIISILAMLVNIAIDGDFALLRVATDARKSQGNFFGFAFLSSLGTVSLVIGAFTRRFNWLHLVSAAIYLSLHLLSGQRFIAIVSIILVLSTVGSLDRLTSAGVRRLSLLLVSIVGAFLIVSQFRGGVADHNRYFIRTGIYNGDPTELNQTEILRYVGMSQRNMTLVMDRGFADFDFLKFTLSPVSGLLGQGVDGGLGTSTYGYTANNALAYLYHDAGVLWPLLLGVWAVVINVSYWRMRAKPLSLTMRFCWSVAALSVALSFFAYVNAYVYWVLLFPLIVAFLELLVSSKKSDTVTTQGSSDSGGPELALSVRESDLGF